MVPRLSLPYLHPVKNLHCTAVRGDKMERIRDKEWGETWRREVLGEKEQRQTKEWVHCLLISAWLVMKRGCNVQCTKHNVCRANTSFDAWCKNFQHLLRRRQQASHQTPTLYPPLQTTAKTGWIKHVPHQFSCNFLSILRWSKEFGLGEKGFLLSRLCEVPLIGQVQRMLSCDLWQRRDFGDFGLGAWGRMSVSARVCFVLFLSACVKSILIGAMNKIKGCDWFRGKLDSSAAEGCHGCQVPVGLHCKSTH